MSITDFVKQAPKAELNLRLEGAMNPATLKMIASQNDIPQTIRKFADLMRQIEKPELKHSDDLARVASSWISTPLELARVVYDAATGLARQNVRYAEIIVTPGLYEGLGLRLEDLFVALNDGRDRAQRAWGIRINWLMAIPRDEPRRADDAVRFAGSVPGRRANVAGVALLGREDVQPVGQFERAFRSAEKHEIARVVQAGAVEGADGITQALDTLSLTRLVDGWNVWTSPDLLTRLAEKRIGVVAGVTRGLKAGVISAAADYPLQTLIDADVPVTLSVDAPSLLGETLTDAYGRVAGKGGLDSDNLRELLLNGARMALLPADERAALEASFAAELDAAAEKL